MDKIHNKNNSLSYTEYNEALLSLYFIKNFNTNNTYKPYKKNLGHCMECRFYCRLDITKAFHIFLES